MDITTLSLAKKYANKVAAGFLWCIVVQSKDYKKRDKSQEETLKCLL